MGGRDVGVNPGPAMDNGRRVSNEGSQYQAVSSAWRGAIQQAQTVAGEAAVVSGYGRFGEQFVGAIDQLLRHAQDTGNAITGAGGAAAGTDEQNAAGFGRVQVPYLPGHQPQRSPWSR